MKAVLASLLSVLMPLAPSRAETLDRMACDGTQAVMVSQCRAEDDVECRDQSLTLDSSGARVSVPLIGRPTKLAGMRPSRGLDYYVYDWACVTSGQQTFLVLVYRCAAGFQGCRDDDNRDDKNITQFLSLDGRDIDKLGPRSKEYWAIARRLGLARVFDPPGLKMTTLSFLAPAKQGR